MTDYEQEFRKNANACGSPRPEFVQFFGSAPEKLSVLDLGCGQGRDALAAAEHGHRVHGVDISPEGVRQMLAAGAQRGLEVGGEVADIESFCTEETYDVVVLDRVLHMLPSDARRESVLNNVVEWVRAGGCVLVADTRSHRDQIRGFFSKLEWTAELKRGDLLIVRRKLTRPR